MSTSHSTVPSDRKLREVLAEARNLQPQKLYTLVADNEMYEYILPDDPHIGLLFPEEDSAILNDNYRTWQENNYQPIEGDFTERIAHRLMNFRLKQEALQGSTIDETMTVISYALMTDMVRLLQHNLTYLLYPEPNDFAITGSSLIQKEPLGDFDLIVNKPPDPAMIKLLLKEGLKVHDHHQDDLLVSQKPGVIHGCGVYQSLGNNQPDKKIMDIIWPAFPEFDWPAAMPTLLLYDPIIPRGELKSVYHNNSLIILMNNNRFDSPAQRLERLDPEIFIAPILANQAYLEHISCSSMNLKRILKLISAHVQHRLLENPHGNSLEYYYSVLDPPFYRWFKTSMKEMRTNYPSMTNLNLEQQGQYFRRFDYLVQILQVAGQHWDFITNLNVPPKVLANHQRDYVMFLLDIGVDEYFRKTVNDPEQGQSVHFIASLIAHQQLPMNLQKLRTLAWRDQRLAKEFKQE